MGRHVIRVVGAAGLVVVDEDGLERGEKPRVVGTRLVGAADHRPWPSGVEAGRGGRQGLRAGDAVGVGERQGVAARRGGAGVARRARSAPALEPHQAAGVPFGDRRTPVDRTVVDHDDLIVRQGGGAGGRQASVQCAGAVADGDHDRNHRGDYKETPAGMRGRSGHTGGRFAPGARKNALMAS